MATLPLNPMTELEAINSMLIGIGEQPVNTLAVDGVIEVDVAQSILHQVSREVQTQGLVCNSETSYPLAVNIDGEILVPQNTLAIDASDGTDVVLRGQRLYNKTDHTYKFEETLECDITFFLGFEELPQVVRDYLTIKAARVFQSRLIGSEALHQFSAADEQKAYMNLFREQIDNGDYNMLNNPDTQVMLKRW